MQRSDRLGTDLSERLGTERSDQPDTERSDQLDTDLSERLGTERSDQPDTERSDQLETARRDQPDTERSDQLGTERNDQPDTERRDQLGTIARLVAAAAILVAGLVHLQLYFDGYRDVPNANLGRSFVANGIASVVIAAGLVVSRHWIVRLAGIGLVAATLLGSALSRTDSGIFGFTETGWGPTPQGPLALATEVVALLLLAATFLLRRVGPGVAVSVRAAVPVVAATALGAVVLSVLWNRTPEGSAETPGGTAVEIADFQFVAAEITVAAGDTVTWTNRDSFPHSVVAEDDTFASDSLDAGAQFDHRFDTPGTYRYICGIHPRMTGTVVVE